MKWKIEVNKPQSISTSPARVSIPIPHGMKAKEFSITTPDGKIIPAQHRPLTHWSDGSPRWIQLDFLAEKSGIYEVKSELATEKPAQILQIKKSGSDITVTSGRLSVTLNSQTPCGISRIYWDEKPTTKGTVPFNFAVTTLDGIPFSAGSSISGFKIESEGPFRFQVSWTTKHFDSAGNGLLDVLFRAEFLAGIEGFSLSYQFFHKIPKRIYLDLESIDAYFRFDPLAENDGHALLTQEAYTEFWLRRFVKTKQTIPIFLDKTRASTYVKDGKSLLDDESNYPWFLMNSEERPVGHAVAIENKKVAISCVMENFLQQRPKTITVQPGVFAFGIWPKRAGTLSIPQGRSCRQVFHFRFCEPQTQTIEDIIAKPNQFLVHPCHCWLAPEDSVHAGPTWEQPSLFSGKGKATEYLSYFLTNGAMRWITVSEMFNYGDVPDIGYTLGYPALGRGPSKTKTQEFILSETGSPHQFFHTSDQMPPVWTNNEYDVIYCLMLESLRTKNTALLEKAKSAARHQIEVDFVHYSDYWQHNRSTPAHTYDHVTTTASIPSHQWTQGLYYYYVVTGDDDVPDVIKAICDYNLMHINRPELADALQFDRELGWTVLALVFGYETTGESKYIVAAKKIIKRLTELADQKNGAEYEKRHPTSRRLTIAGIGGGFNVNTIPLAVKSYHQATGEQWAYDLLKEWVELGLKNLNDRATGNKLSELFFDPLCYVSERENKKKYLKDSIWHLVLFFKGIGSLNWVPHNDLPLSTKQFARIYRGLLPYISTMQRMGLVEWMVKETLGNHHNFGYYG